MRKRGITLIELIIVIAILGLVISLGFSFVIFGQNIFGKGSTQAEIQSELRLANDIVKNELRYATVIELLPSVGTVINGSSYIYIDGNRLIYDKVDSAGNITKRELTGPNIINSTAAFALKKDTNDVNSINIILESKARDQQFAVTSEILLMNIRKMPAKTDFVIRFVE